MDKPLKFEFARSNEIVCTLNGYTELFKGAKKDQVVGEATVGYLYFYQDTIRNIYKVYGPCARRLKILIIIRNPVERAYAHYRSVWMDGLESLSFERAISRETIESRKRDGLDSGYDYIGYGMYAEGIRAYLDAFDDVKVILSEDLRDDTAETVRSIYKFLGVDYRFVPDMGRMNRSGNIKYKGIHNLFLFIRSNPFTRNFLSFILPRSLIFYIRNKYLNLNVSNDRGGVSKENSEYLKRLYSKDIARTMELVNIDLKHWLDV